MQPEDPVVAQAAGAVRACDPDGVGMEHGPKAAPNPEKGPLAEKGRPHVPDSVCFVMFATGLKLLIQVEIFGRKSGRIVHLAV